MSETLPLQTVEKARRLDKLRVTDMSIPGAQSFHFQRKACGLAGDYSHFCILISAHGTRQAGVRWSRLLFGV